MKLIVGLGNPGKEYENTRHNAGFMMIDYYASQNGITKFKEFKNGLYAEINSTEKVLRTLLNDDEVDEFIRIQLGLIRS